MPPLSLPHVIICPVTDTVPAVELNVSVYVFPSESVAVHVPEGSFAVPLAERVHVILSSFVHVIVVVVMVTPVLVSVSEFGPLQENVLLVQ